MSNDDKEVLGEPHDAKAHEASDVPRLSMNVGESTKTEILALNDQPSRSAQPEFQPVPEMQEFPEPAFNLLFLGTESERTRCPYCRQTVNTKIVKHNSRGAYMASGLIVAFGCWLGCCLIPFLIDEFKIVEHYCSNCDKFLGTSNRD